MFLGIFSFKCQRADVLFNTLQSFINGRAYNTDMDTNLHDFAVPNASNRNIAQLNSLNLGGGTLHHTGIQGSSYIVNARPNSSLSPNGTNSIQSRSTDNLTADYLEPNPTRSMTSHVARFSSSNRMNSFGSGPLSPGSPGSPNSYTNILEITNLNQPPTHAVGNIYQESGYQQKPTKLAIEVPMEQAPSVSSVVTPSSGSVVSAIAVSAVTSQFKPSSSASASVVSVAAASGVAHKCDTGSNIYMNAEIGDPRKSVVTAVESESKPAPRATLAQMESIEVEPDEDLPPQSQPLQLQQQQSISSPDSVKANTALYMNVVVGEENNQITSPTTNSADAKENQPPLAITPPVLTNNLNSKSNEVKKDYTKNVVNGNIFGFTRALSFSQDPTRCYENLEIGLSEMKPLTSKNRYSRPEIFSKVDLPLIDRTDKSEPCTPTQRKVVNYIVLDLDQPQQPLSNNMNNNNNSNSSNGNNKGSADSCSDNQSQMASSTSASSGGLQPESPKKLGYATIDFNRSNALSNILLNNPINDFDQSCRKTRHDSNVTPILMAMKHSNSMSD